MERAATADKLKWDRHKHYNNRNIWFIIGYLLLICIGKLGADNANETAKINPDDVGTVQRYGYRDSGTTHEQMGQRHWNDVEYTKYVSKAKYRETPKFAYRGLRPIFNLTHYLFNSTLTDEPALPAGYIVVKSDQTVALGPKMEYHDYRDLLWEYWFYLIWVMFVLLLIIIIPFIAVCYCCFCCCRRCPRGCPPCDHKRNASLRFLCGFLLLLLIAVIIFGVLIAFLANKSLDSGMAETSTLMRRVADDSCTFLKDIKDHVHHLFANNYEEMLNHATDTLFNADKHIFNDLGDTSESDSITQLERIFDNMPEAMNIMKQVNLLEKDLRFLNYQLRDGVRGVKREVHYACGIINQRNCTNFILGGVSDSMDTMKCLHLDQLPDSRKYLDGMKKIIEEHDDQIPKKALQRLQTLQAEISREMDKVAPPIVLDLKKGRDLFLDEADKLRKIVEAAVSDIHFNSARKSRSLEDMYEKFAPDRHLVNSFVCILIVVIVCFLLIALICGCLFSKSAGANCLLLAIILIFCFFSFIALVGLFYFVLGLLTYQGGCVPMQSEQKANLYKNLDAKMESFEYVGNFKNRDSKGDQMATQPVRMSNPLTSCKKDESIFNVLAENRLYSVSDLKQIKILAEDDGEIAEIDKDFNKIFLLTKDERKQLTTTVVGNLSTYQGSLYLEIMCETLTPISLPSMANKLDWLVYDLYTSWGDSSWLERQSIIDGANQLRLYDREFAQKIIWTQRQIKQKLAKIDELILYNGLNFSDSIRVLLDATMRAEAFIQSRGKNFINELVQNLTDSVGEQVDVYTDMVITQCNTKVGRCEPLTYVYNRGVDLVCNHLIDPVNAFWFGVLLCVICFLPVLCVSHRLLCLYKTYSPFVTTSRPARHLACPICTGAPFVAPPIVACSGGQQVYKEAGRSTGGKNDGHYIISMEQLNNESYILEETESQTAREKRKKE